MDQWKRMEGQIANPQQLASYLMQTLMLLNDANDQNMDGAVVPLSALHWHDDATCNIAWNNVQSVIYYNRLTGASVPVPLTATEGYNKHGHSSEMDGGYIPGRGIHNHSSNFDGGLAFAVFHPGTGLPQQRFAI